MNTEQINGRWEYTATQEELYQNKRYGYYHVASNGDVVVWGEELSGPDGMHFFLFDEGQTRKAIKETKAYLRNARDVTGFSMVHVKQRSIDDWIYPLVDLMYNTGDHSWLEVSERIYWDQLGCVPPAAQKDNAFMVGECWKYDVEGRAVHTAFCYVRGRLFARNDRIMNFNPATYTAEIQKQFNISADTRNREELIECASRYINRSLAAKKDTGWLRSFVDARESEEGRLNQERGSAGLEAGATVRRNFGV